MYTRLYIENDAVHKQVFKSKRAGARAKNAGSQHKFLIILPTAVFFPSEKMTALETNSFWSCLMTIYSFL